MDVPNFFQEKPYTLKVPKRFLFLSKVYVLFEDTPVRVLNMSRKDAEDIVFLLNTAWALGASSGYILGECEKEKNSQACEEMPIKT